ncbi:hypothetical protein, partial [Klebsiella pneumoniae]|uniref:hypothetical protein n=1 Tax=Klebsiella pneumoniae TaxID=573 RepID=UPI001F4D9E72
SAIDQIAQFGLSSLKVIYYSEQLFSRYSSEVSSLALLTHLADCHTMHATGQRGRPSFTPQSSLVTNVLRFYGAKMIALLSAITL